MIVIKRVSKLARNQTTGLPEINGLESITVLISIENVSSVMTNTILKETPIIDMMTVKQFDFGLILGVIMSVIFLYQ